MISSLLPGSGKNRLLIKCSPIDLPIRHLREMEPGLVVDYVESRLPFEDADDLSKASIVDGPVIYAGPVWYHFGHFVTDGVHRLWPRLIHPELARARIAFHWIWRPAPPLPPWGAEILGFFGVRADEVLFIDKPTRFSQIYFPAKGRIAWGPPQFPGYDQLLAQQTAGLRSHDASPLIYVSRSAIEHGRLIGERLLETILAAAGFTIIQPEKMRVAETIAALRSARTVVFAEGSTLHNLELSGPIEAEVFVIARRNGCRKRFGRLLADLTPRSTIFTRTQLRWSRWNGTPSRRRHPTRAHRR
jgi:capsular polysaccharide biosynthesis protein